MQNKCVDGQETLTCPVFFFKKINRSLGNVAHKLVLHLKVHPVALFQLIRTAPDNLFTAQ
jgi:hypothetical protein